MPRGVYLLGVGLALGLALTDWAVSLQLGVTETNAGRVRAGMTLAEVRSLFGGPGRCYADAAAARHWVGGEAQRFFEWTCGEARAWVGLDSLGRVTRFGFGRTAPTPGLIACLRTWLGW
jgi:hypothetical protein